MAWEGDGCAKLLPDRREEVSELVGQKEADLPDRKEEKMESVG